jgi:hypothetical protein
MPRGGARPNAGRKKGQATRLNEEARKAALAGGTSPLDFLLEAMRDDQREFSVRLDAAKAAAPYVHARLASVAVGGTDGEPIQQITRIEHVIIDPAAGTCEPLPYR